MALACKGILFAAQHEHASSPGHCSLFVEFIYFGEHELLNAIHLGPRNADHLLPLALLLILSCSSHKHDTSDVPPAESYRSFTQDGAWCWFSDPRAIHYNGKTYSGWVDSVGNIVLGTYDHADGKIETHVLHERFEKDDHDNPSFLLDEQARLMVFYTKHATGNSPIFLARAKKPESIYEWKPLQTLRLNDTIAYAGMSNTYTYTNIVRLSEEQGKLYLFWRGADFKPNMSTSTDMGHTWQQGKIMVLPERIYRDRRPYMKIASNNKDVIHFAFTDGHPHVEPTNSIYYAKYRHGALYKANGDKIMDWSALPVDPKNADIVYDATDSKEKSWIWDIAENNEGNPVVVYATFPTDSSHVYYYSIYDGAKWNTHKLLDSGPWFPHTPEGAREREPNYSGGIVLDHKDPSQVYLSREKNGVFEIEHWSTSDKGKSWQVAEITRDSKLDNVRPFVIRDHPDGAPKVLWMNVTKYLHYTDYQSGIKMSTK